MQDPWAGPNFPSIPEILADSFGNIPGAIVGEYAQSRLGGIRSDSESESENDPEDDEPVWVPTPLSDSVCDPVQLVASTPRPVPAALAGNPPGHNDNDAAGFHHGSDEMGSDEDEMWDIVDEMRRSEAAESGPPTRSPYFDPPPANGQSASVEVDAYPATRDWLRTTIPALSEWNGTDARGAESSAYETDATGEPFCRPRKQRRVHGPPSVPEPRSPVWDGPCDSCDREETVWCFGCMWGSVYHSPVDNEKVRNLVDTLQKTLFSGFVSLKNVGVLISEQYEQTIRQPALALSEYLPEWPPDSVVRHIKNMSEPQIRQFMALREYQTILNQLKPHIFLRDANSGRESVDLGVLRQYNQTTDTFFKLQHKDPKGAFGYNASLNADPANYACFIHPSRIDGRPTEETDPGAPVVAASARGVRMPAVINGGADSGEPRVPSNKEELLRRGGSVAGEGRSWKIAKRRRRRKKAPTT